MTTSETSVQAACRAEAARQNCYLWRNNSGVLYDSRGVPVRFGLGNDSKKINDVFKSSDLIGLTASGRFVAIECKAPGWVAPRNQRERAQLAFLEAVHRSNGIAAFVTHIRQVKGLFR